MRYDALIALLFIVFPLRYFFPVDPEAAADATMFDYVTDDPPCLSNQASPPFDHPDIAHSILSCLH